MKRTRLLLAGLVTGAAAFLLIAGPAAAHGLVLRADLPIPEYLFNYGAAVVLIVSFFALAVLWPRPKLERTSNWRPLPGALGRVLGSVWLETVCQLIGAVLLVVTVLSAFFGVDNALDNFAPTFVLITFWVGLVFVSVVFGDVYRAFNPWRAFGRGTGWLVARLRGGKPVPVRPYPERLGRWPAALGLLGFTWLELVDQGGAQPRTLGVAIVVYSVLTFAGMARYGAEPWTRNGEAFAVYFGLFARISPFEKRDGVVGVRTPLSGLTRLDDLPGTVGVIAVMIGTVTFDGFSQGKIWKDVSLELEKLWTSMGFPIGWTPNLTGTVGLLLGVGVVAGFYWLGIEGARSVGGNLGSQRLRSGFVHSLVPIAVVYAAAHYFSYLLKEGQGIFYLASDPLGKGWDLFGTASASIDFGVISQNGTWYAQVAFVVIGHVAALMLAHDRALVLYGQAKLAVRSQYWMLAVMVGFTTLALWLLAQANA